VLPTAAIGALLAWQPTSASIAANVDTTGPGVPPEAAIVAYSLFMPHSAC